MNEIMGAQSGATKIRQENNRPASEKMCEMTRLHVGIHAGFSTEPENTKTEKASKPLAAGGAYAVPPQQALREAPPPL